jgi:cell division transport system permease protein
VTRLGYFLGRAFGNLKARPWATAATVLTIALAFALLAAYLQLFQGLARAADVWAERLEVSAYLDGALSEADGRAIASRAAAWPEVQRATYVSRADALQRFRVSLGGQASLLDALPGNPLPASIEVALAPNARTPGGLVGVADRLRQLPGVTDVEYGREEAARLAALLRVVRVVGAAVAVVLGLVATLIVANTVRLALYAREEELALLRLVGATEAFVRAPFLIEGALQGALGAAVAVALAAAGYQLARPSLAGLGDLLGPATGRLLPLGTIAALVGAGALLGLVGSALSTRRRD